MGEERNGDRFGRSRSGIASRRRARRRARHQGRQCGDGRQAAVRRARRLRGGQARPDRAGARGHGAKSASGTVLWNLGEYAFIDGELAPATVNPSLWRMARLNMANGLFKVTDRLYQLRGFDIANMTVIEGDTRPDPDRSADHRRGRPRRPRALLRASAEEAGRRGDLHPQPRRPLRRRARRDRRGRRQGGQGRGDRARRIHGGGVGRERAGRHADGAPRAVPVRHHAAARPARPGRCRPGQGHRARLDRPDRADHEHRRSRSRSTRSTASGSSSSSRPRPRRRPRCTCSIPQLGVLNMAENACPLLHNFIPLARRRGARSAHLGQVHRRCHRDVWRRRPTS